ncbi:MAG TPA: quinolinate synthase, partial [Maritimibacter sp.]|nr:quinolinate synthase [Maritimibacter sp.]
MLDFRTMRQELAEVYDLAPNEALAEEMRDIYEAMDRVVPWPDFVRAAPYIKAINTLKVEKDAVILAHNYMTP